MSASEVAEAVSALSVLCRDVWAGPKEPFTNFILVGLFCLGGSQKLYTYICPKDVMPHLAIPCMITAAKHMYGSRLHDMCQSFEAD